MKKIIFSNGTEIAFSDESTMESLETVVSAYAALDNIREAFADGLDGATFDGVDVSDYIHLGSSAYENGGNIVATFTNRQKTELELFKEQIAEEQEMQNDALNALIMGA